MGLAACPGLMLSEPFGLTDLPRSQDIVLNAQTG
jgi:hypothetical protein